MMLPRDLLLDLRGKRAVPPNFLVNHSNSSYRAEGCTY